MHQCIFWILFTVIFSSCFSFLKAQEPCRTPNGVNGECINLRNCPSLMMLLQQKPLPQSAIDHLQRSRCGQFEGNYPRVCCPDRTQVVTTPPTPPIPSPGSGTSGNRPADVSWHPNLRLLQRDVCGPINDDRIVGGESTSVFQYPWMALLAYRTRSGVQYRCGGSVINDRYVLTAAHCVVRLPSSLTLVSVRLGEHDTATEMDCDFFDGENICAVPPQDFGIEQVIAHPGFTSSALQNDIALIRLDRRADFRPDTVRPICLPVGEQQWRNMDNMDVTVAGWGTTESGMSSTKLLQAHLPVVPNQQCARTYQTQATIGPNQMCAGGLQGIDSCAGDSGGPLKFIDTSENQYRYHQFGIVSFGPRNCGTRGRPGVYTRVGYYMQWILDNIRP